MAANELDGAIAVVTGGANGIGYAIAERCRARGMTVALVDVEALALVQAVEDLGSKGVVGIDADVRSDDSMAEVAGRVRDQLGPVEILCNNAGVAGPLGMAWELSTESWRWVLETNLWGVIHGIRHFVPEMVRRDRGRILNLGSIGGLLPLPASGPYSVSKFGIVAVTEVLAEELRMCGSQVTASVACPGEVRTRITDDMRNWPQDLGPPPPEPSNDQLVALGEEVREAIDSGSDPAAVAEEILVGALEGRFWIHTHLDNNRDAIAERTDSILGG